MGSSRGAVGGPGLPASGGFQPEPTRARGAEEPAARPQLGRAADPDPFADSPTEVQNDSEPPGPGPAVRAIGGDTGREEAESLPPPAPSQPADAFAEFEGSMAGESTRIEDSDILAEQSTAILDEGPRLPYLFVEAGKDAGREYALQEGETSIGRGIDNDVILADVSVSRRHVRVVREGATITLRDLGSGNGTQLNGRRAHVEPLNEGDRIELGETILVLRVPGAEIGAADRASATHETAAPISSQMPSMPQPPLYGTPPALPSLPVVGSSTDELLAPRDGRTQSIILPRRILFVAAAAVAIVGSVIGAGVVTFMGRDPDTVATSIPPRLPGAATALPVGPTALAPPTALPAGPTALPGVVPQALPTTPVVPATVPAVPPSVPPVVPVAGPATPAIPASGTVSPGTVSPGTVSPGTVSPGTVAPEAVASAEDTPRAGGGRRTGGGGGGRVREPTTAEAAGGGGGGGGRSAAIAAYRSADFAGAERLAREAARAASARDRRGLETLANNIHSFAEVYPRIRSAGTNYSTVASVGLSAIRLDRTIAGGHHTRTFAPGFLDWMLDQAEGSFARDPATACRQAHSASDVEASARTRALLARCDSRATEMIAEARRAERSDPSRARDLYRSIIRLAPGSPEAAEAARRVDALGRSRTVDEDE